MSIEMQLVASIHMPVSSEGEKRQRVDMWNCYMLKESRLGLNTAVNEPHVNTLKTSFHFAFVYVS